MRDANAGIILKGRKRIMRSFKLCEISAVDVPAQEGAVMTLMKRNDSAPQTGKDNPSKEESLMTIDTNSAEFKAELAKAVAPVQTELDTAKAELAKIEKAKQDAEAEAAAKAADEVLYKSADGTEYKKSGGQALADMAKKNDELQAQINKAKDAQETAEIAKAAGEAMDKLPGDEALKVSIYKALKGIDGALELLKAANTAASGAFKSEGTTGGDKVDTKVEATNKAEATAKLDEMAKKVAEEKKVTYVKAYNMVLDTAEGKKLYELTTVAPKAE